MTPNTIAAMKPNDSSAASTFSRTTSSIVASQMCGRLFWQLDLRHGETLKAVPKQKC
jgi:hypothetical protein